MIEIKNCLIDNGSLVQVVDLEKIKWMKCNMCHFVQTKFQGSTEEYKKKPLPNANDAEHQQILLAIAKKAQAMVQMISGDKVLDIGCGDGKLLGWYDKGTVTVGVDPSVELIKEGLNEKRIDIGISNFFSIAAVSEICKLMGAGMLKFKIITAVDVLDLVPDPLKFIGDCRDLLHDEGVIVVQVNHLMAVMAQNKINKIDKQFGFYNILPFRELVNQVGLDLQGVELQEDASFRAYVTKRGFNTFGADDYENKLWLLNNANIKMVEEMRYGIDNPIMYQQFGNKIINYNEGNEGNATMQSRRGA